MLLEAYDSKCTEQFTSIFRCGKKRKKLIAIGNDAPYKDLYAISSILFRQEKEFFSYPKNIKKECEK